MRYKRNSLIGILLAHVLTVFLIASLCYATEFPSEVLEIGTDAEESRGLYEEDRRFVPVPIPKSDPTIGTGLAVAGVYLHPKREGEEDSPASVSGVYGLYTDTESWLVGIFHDGFYSNDRYRVRNVIGYGEFNLKFYGIGNDSILRDRPVDYKAKGKAFLPRILFRLPVKKWFIGLRYLYLEIDNSFSLSRLLPQLPEIEFTTSTAALGFVALFDSRDSNLWPSDGTWFELTASDYGDTFGGDFEYEKLIVKFAQYFPLTDSITFVYRLDGKFIDGSAPFYDLSNVNLRGFPQGIFLDDHAVTAQVEGRWNFYERWTALVFGGGGRIAGQIDDLGSSPTNYAGGAGIRYMINREQKLNVGVDITYGENEVEFYVQIGDWLGN